MNVKLKLKILIRFLLACGLIYLCYTETGLWTSITLFLIFLFVEIK